MLLGGGARAWLVASASEEVCDSQRASEQASCLAEHHEPSAARVRSCLLDGRRPPCRKGIDRLWKIGPLAHAAHASAALRLRWGDAVACFVFDSTRSEASRSKSAKPKMTTGGARGRLLNAAWRRYPRYCGLACCCRCRNPQHSPVEVRSLGQRSVAACDEASAARCRDARAQGFRSRSHRSLAAKMCRPGRCRPDSDARSKLSWELRASMLGSARHDR